MAIALAALIGGSFSRLGYNGRIGAAAGAAATVRLLGFAAQAFATHAVWVNLLQLAAPAIVTAIALHRVFPRKIGRAARAPRGRLLLAGARP